MNRDNLLDKITSLCKRRGFIFPSSEIYGGLANFWDYGPLGVELKNNIKKLWWRKFVQSRDDVVGLDTALIMNPKVWQASGHLGAGFSDLLVECKNCHNRFRRDKIKNKCPNCGGQLTEPKQFNLMFKTFLGPAEETANVAYFRPETAQGMFVNFKNILDTTRMTLPFGVAQIGKAFRNEVTPGNFIFRLREFEMMEIEYFVEEKDWEKYFEYWRKQMIDWLKELGADIKKIHEKEIPEKERAHYSQKTLDFEYEFPFGQKELYGLAYRADFDLKAHFKEPPYNGFWPHVIEPTWGVDRSVLVALLEAYFEEKDPEKNGASRIVLKLPSKLAPYQAAVFPLLANKPALVKLARKICDDLRKPARHAGGDLMVAFDDRGNIGKRYYSQDEIGTPFCLTVDFESLENQDVTIRNRDTTKQKRVKIKDLKEILEKEFEK